MFSNWFPLRKGEAGPAHVAVHPHPVRRRAAAPAALAQCFEELGFPLAFEHDASLPAQGARHLPILLRGEELGFELGVRNGRRDVEDIAGEEIDPRFTRAVSVQSPGGDEADAAASCFAGALAQLTDGITLRSYSNVDLTPDRASRDRTRGAGGHG